MFWIDRSREMWLCSISLGLISCKIYENVKSFSKFFSPKGCDWDGKAEAGSLDRHPLVGRKKTAREQIETTTEISLLHTNQLLNRDHLLHQRSWLLYSAGNLLLRSPCAALCLPCPTDPPSITSGFFFKEYFDTAQYLVMIINRRTYVT